MMTFKTRPGVVLTEIAGEFILVAAKSLQGVCPYVTQINETSAFLWRQLEQGAGLEKLEEVGKPIYEAISEARTRVLDEVTGKMCESALRPVFIRKFDDLKDKAEQCNNIAYLQSIKVEADALKVRSLDEIAKQEEYLKIGKEGRETPPELKKPVKQQKHISIKSVNTASSWQLETAEDVDKYLNELRGKLISRLEENTVVHIEF